VLSLPLQSGLVGLPNAGKSTLFNALTRAGALVAGYPFTTIEPNEGVVELPDARLDALVRTVNPREVVPAVVHFVDIAGLVQGASQGEGLGNQFLGHIRDVDAVVHVVRCFTDPNVAHVTGAIDPAGDIAVVETELILADLQTVNKRLMRAERDIKTGEQRYREEYAALQLLQAQLERGEPARRCPPLPITAPEHAATLWRELALLTAKPVIYCANCDDDDLTGSAPFVKQVEEVARREDAGFVAISAKLEAELAELPSAEAQAFLAELGLPEAGLARLARAAYSKLGLITFYTVKGPQTRAWSIPNGTTALQAAGKIHSDMERGFIRAQVVSWQDLVEAGAWAGAREQGRLRTEGRDYIVQDGDVIQFLFNV
jgi:GTP-binding protein YchF